MEKLSKQTSPTVATYACFFWKTTSSKDKKAISLITHDNMDKQWILKIIHLWSIRKRSRVDAGPGRDRSREGSPRIAPRRKVSRSPLRRRSPSLRRRSRSSPRRRSRSPLGHRYFYFIYLFFCRNHQLTVPILKSKVGPLLLVYVFKWLIIYLDMTCRSGERDRYGRLRQYRRSMSRDRGRRRRRSRDEDKFKGSLSEGMKVDQESSEGET